MAVNPGWTRAPWAGVPQPSPQGQQAGDDEDSPAAACFHTTRDVHVGTDTFCVHCAGDWAARPQPPPLVVLLHGAGYCGLTWSFVTRRLLRLVTCRVAALDLRGHGASVTSDETDFSRQRLVADVVAVCGMLASDGAPVILVGHSMGGALVSHASAELSQAHPGIRLRGLVVLDCVEGTALDSMPVMEAAIRARPQEFPTVDAALQWWLKAGLTRHEAAARQSLEAQLRVRGPAGQLGWRTDVAASVPHWSSWFTGQGAAFLTGCAAPKLLLLSDARLLDARLTAAHMQGRFQLVVVPLAGHALHEDNPGQTAAALAAFIRRCVVT